MHIFPFSMTSDEFLRGLVTVPADAAGSRGPGAAPGPALPRQPKRGRGAAGSVRKNLRGGFSAFPQPRQDAEFSRG